MTLLTLAAVVGTLFATGTYLILRRRAVRLILGLGLLTHGVNLLLFSSSGLGHGLPPIILDKKAFAASDVALYVDPLPQALILTAIVISFGVTAFTVVLVNRRQALARVTGSGPQELPSAKASDPFALTEHYGSGLDADSDDYEWLEFSLADELRARRSKIQTKMQEDATASEGASQTNTKAENNAVASVSDALDAQDGDLFTSEEFIGDSSSEQNFADSDAPETDDPDGDESNNSGDVAT